VDDVSWHAMPRRALCRHMLRYKKEEAHDERSFCQIALCSCERLRSSNSDTTLRKAIEELELTVAS